MEPSTSLLDGDSPTGENMAVSGGAIVFSRTAIAVGSLACPRSTPTEYRRGEYFGILGAWYSVSHAITIRRLLSGWLLRSPRRRGHSLCRRMRRESPRYPATRSRTLAERTAPASSLGTLRGLQTGCALPRSSEPSSVASHHPSAISHGRTLSYLEA